jgi:hypothetical protein
MSHSHVHKGNAQDNDPHQYWRCLAYQGPGPDGHVHIRLCAQKSG